MLDAPIRIYDSDEHQSGGNLVEEPGSVFYLQRLQDDRGVFQVKILNTQANVTIQGRLHDTQPWVTIVAADETKVGANGSAFWVTSLPPQVRVDISSVSAPGTADIEVWLAQ